MVQKVKEHQTNLGGYLSAYTANSPCFKTKVHRLNQSSREKGVRTRMLGKMAGI